MLMAMHICLHVIIAFFRCFFPSLLKALFWSIVNLKLRGNFKSQNTALRVPLDVGSESATETDNANIASHSISILERTWPSNSNYFVRPSRRTSSLACSERPKKSILSRYAPFAFSYLSSSSLSFSLSTYPAQSILLFSTVFNFCPCSSFL